MIRMIRKGTFNQWLIRTGSRWRLTRSIAGGVATVRVLTVDNVSGAGGSSISFEVDLYLAVPAGVETFYVRSTSDPGVEVQLAVAGAQPRAVNRSNTLFEASPQ